MNAFCNCLMVVTSLAMSFAHCCGTNPVLEQPSNSCLPKLEPLQSALSLMGASKTTIWHGAYGGTSPKPLQLWSAKDMSSLKRPKPQHLSSHLVKKQSTKQADGKMKNTYTGKTKALLQSQVYSSSFGNAVASVAKTWLIHPRSGVEMS